MQDEILVKGQDGKWYILKGEELLPYEEARPTRPVAPARPVELPKGVAFETHERFEKSQLPISKSQTISSTQYPISKPTVFPPVSHEGHPLVKELEELIDRVVSQSGVSFSNPVLQKRLRALVSSRLRDVRDALEARAILTRDQKVGGLGLQEGECAKTEEQMEQAFTEFQAKWKTVEDRKIAEWKRKQLEQPLVKPLIPSTELQTPPQSKLDTRQAIPEPQIPKPALPSPKPISPPPPLPLIPSTLKPLGKITDIRLAPKLLGPVEELASLTLEDFRRLGGVEEAVKKILSRVEVLSSQGLARRLDGIKAWQNSPLHRLYMDLTAAALAQRKSVDMVIADRQSRSEPTLTSAEFHGIMELNQKLRF